jgi:hypothetical protein
MKIIRLMEESGFFFAFTCQTSKIKRKTKPLHNYRSLCPVFAGKTICASWVYVYKLREDLERRKE